MELTIIKRDGQKVPFDIDRITNAVFAAAKSVGGDNVKKSHRIAYRVLDILEEEATAKSINEFEVEHIQDLVEQELIESGHAKTAKAYILYRQKRSDVRSLKSVENKTITDLVFKDASEVEDKRENANIDGNSVMGTMLKVGSTVMKEYVTKNVMKPKHADMYKRGVIHYHDMDFSLLCVNCISPNTRIVIEDPSGHQFVTTASYFTVYGEGVTKLDPGWKILSKDGEFTDLKKVMIRKEESHINKIETIHGYLELTDNHIVPVNRNNIDIEIPAKELRIGDKFTIGSFNNVSKKDVYTEINLIDLFGSAEFIAIDESDELYKLLRYNNLNRVLYSRLAAKKLRIRDIHNNRITLSEYFVIREELLNMGVIENELHLTQLQGRVRIPSILKVNSDLGRFIGYLYTEGCVNKSSISLTNSDPQIVDEFVNLGKKIFPDITPHMSVNKNETAIITFGSKLLSFIFRNGLGYHFGSGNLRIPEWMFNACDDFKRGFLSACIDGDGCVDPNSYSNIVTSSEKFARDLQYFTWTIGLTTSINVRNSAGTIAKFGNITSIRKYNNYSVVFKNRELKELNLSECIKARKLENTDVSEKRKDNYNTVKSIKQESYNDYVFDFETGNHYFVANTNIVHNCAQIPLNKLLEHGFVTGHGSLRSPSTIGSASTLACIAIQSNQNDMFGGQGIPNLDNDLAPYVAKSYIRNIATYLEITCFIDTDRIKKEFIKPLDEYIREHKRIMNQKGREYITNYLRNNFSNYYISFSDMHNYAIKKTERDTYQAMEAMVHNLCTLNCVSGNEEIFVYNTNLNKYQTYTLKEFYNVFKKNTFTIMSIDTKSGNPSAKYITDCVKLDNKKKMIEITIDNNKSLTTTFDHLYLTKNKKKLEYITAEEIEEVICPLGNSYIVNKVISKKELPVEDTVYCLEVEDNHNFVTTANMVISNCRSGGQVPFSSVNFGIDTTEEGRMVSRNIMLAIDAGLGSGETSIFPIAIMKLMSGVTDKGSPNYDLFQLSCKVSAKRLFPNWLSLDATFNKKYYKGTPETEVATMGCVDGNEVVIWKYKDEIQVTNFITMYDYLNNIFNVNKYSKVSEYLDCEYSKDVKIWDSNVNDFVIVKKVIRNYNITNWRRITCNNGRVLELTGDHPLPVLNKGRTIVDNLQLNDKLPIISDYTHVFSNTNESTIEEEQLAWLLGIVICDGCLLNSKNTIVISLGPDELDICDKVEEYSKHLLLLQDSTNYTLDDIKVKRIYRERGEKGNYYDISILVPNEIKTKIVNYFGSKLKIKRSIPNWIFTAPYRVKVNFMCGMIDADGYINSRRENSRIQIGSTNKTLSIQQALLAESIGLQAKIYINYYNLNNHDKIRYRVEFFSIEDFRKYLISSKKRDNIKLCYGKVSNSEYCEVIKIEQLPYDHFKYSYDVETESDRFDVSMSNSFNCRTRVIGNHFDPDNEITPGRGNIFFTTVNLPYLALEAKRKYDTGTYTCTLYDVFMSILNETIDEVFDLSMDRFEIVANKKAKNFPFLMGQGLYIGSENLSPDDTIREVIKHGTITMGFIGLAETLVVLTGKHHGESDASQELGLKIIGHMNQRCVDECHKTGLNFSLMGSPAEGCCGRLLKLTRKEFGTIPGVTDHEYLTNSHHIPVYYPISAKKKVDIEAPYHELEPAG